MRSNFSRLLRRTKPYTSHPFSSKNSARYEPSWPVTPVISARMNFLLGINLKSSSCDCLFSPLSPLPHTQNLFAWLLSPMKTRHPFPFPPPLFPPLPLIPQQPPH